MNKQIDQLPAAGSVNPTDLFVIADPDTGDMSSITAAQLPSFPGSYLGGIVRLQDLAQIPGGQNAGFQVGVAKGLLTARDDDDSPPMWEFRRMFTGVEIGRGSVGFLGGTEMNITNNMDYTDGTHKYYDPTKNAIWLALGNVVNGLFIQWVKAGHPNDDTMWTTYGKDIFSVTVIPDGAGEAVEGGCQLNLQQILMIDGDLSSPAVTLRLHSEEMNWDNLSTMHLPGTTFATGGAPFALAVGCLATYKVTGNNTFIVFANEDNNTNYNHYRFLKNKAGNYTIGAGTKVFEFDINGGVAFHGTRGTANAPGGFSNVEFYWTTTNAAAVTAERMVLTEEGVLKLTNVGDFADDAAAAAGSVPVGGVYRTGSALKIRVT